MFAPDLIAAFQVPNRSFGPCALLLLFCCCQSPVLDSELLVMSVTNAAGYSGRPAPSAAVTSPMSGFAACCAAVPTIGVTGVPSGSGSTPSVSACSSLYHTEIVAAAPAPFTLNFLSTVLSLKVTDERGLWLESG